MSTASVWWSAAEIESKRLSVRSLILIIITLILNSLCVVVIGGDRIKEAVGQVININNNNINIKQSVWLTAVKVE